MTLDNEKMNMEGKAMAQKIKLWSPADAFNVRL